ncbi:16S rRNA (cytosine(1402)-N(4))-methyltransferase RsmH [Marinibaculum pumilum]|uniref:Ribosomal RNA small subunit methyltransferase H n=1 Tax=Marinibaculum pumilum TaxID=1766165 RepID=A0ABV7KXR9_9PROT
MPGQGADRQGAAQTSRHLPVMLAPVLEALAPQPGERMVDGTLGGGGYTEAMLAAGASVWAVDRDDAAIDRARRRFADALAEGRLTLLPGRFGDMASLLAAAGVTSVDGVVLDIGLSSDQLDSAERGFAFSVDGPLDMRMGGTGPTAADFVNSAEETELADIVYRYGEERRSRAVARAIAAARSRQPIRRTGELAEIVAQAVGRPRPQRGSRGRSQGHAIHPATRTFQAIRIHVNDELGELERGLRGAEQVLAPGGRLAVVSFHSLEDRIVKSFLAERSGEAAQPSRHAPPQAAATARRPTFSLKWRGVRKPDAAEADDNPRARSARLRAAVRTDAPAWDRSAGMPDAGFGGDAA